MDPDDFNEKDSADWDNNVDIDNLQAGQVGGIIVDPNGAVVANATVTVTNKQTGTTQTTTSDGEGHWAISNVQPGPVSVNGHNSGLQGIPDRSWPSTVRERCGWERLSRSPLPQKQ
jgi:hypothetical protein